MNFAYLDFPGSVLLLGVFSIYAVISLSRLVLSTLERSP
jgi:hypothetical protein